MDLECAHYANDNLTFLWQQSTCFVLKDANSPLLRPVKDFWHVLKKAIYDEGWEATIPSLKRRIEEKAWQIPLLTILCLFITVKEQLALCP